eukprot:112688_1
MDFQNKDFLLSQFIKTIDFHLDNEIDHVAGGYYHQLYPNGKPVDKINRSLVGVCRGILIYAYATVLFDKIQLKDKARACRIACAHGLTFLETHFQQPNEGYAWKLEVLYNNNGSIPNIKVTDNTKMCYGHAFVHACIGAAVKANICSKNLLNKSWKILEKYFYNSKDELYYAEINGNDWNIISNYRGQNCNMHMTEAMIIAYEATLDIKYLNRAITLAKRLMIDLSKQSKHNIFYEHYDNKWQIDYKYNKSEPYYLLRTRPWGYSCGHCAEWAKLLMIIYSLCNKNNNKDKINKWMVDKAIYLFNIVLKFWDVDNGGGILYLFDEEMNVCDNDKYMWCHPEALTSSFLLGMYYKNNKKILNGKDKAKFYFDWYNTIYKYCYTYLIDSKGGWYSLLDVNNQLKTRNIADSNDSEMQKQKTWMSDYHSMSAIYEILRSKL